MGAEMEKNSNLAGTRKISPPDPSLSSPKKRVRQSWVSQKVIFRPLIYGSVLFALGLISLFTGHVVSDIERSKFRKYKTDLDEGGKCSRGKCPLTPYEVGGMLRALGFRNDTHLYVASGERYGGEEILRPLYELFPNFYIKEILAGENFEAFSILLFSPCCH